MKPAPRASDSTKAAGSSQILAPPVYAAHKPLASIRKWSSPRGDCLRPAVKPEISRPVCAQAALVAPQKTVVPPNCIAVFCLIFSSLNFYTHIPP
ncbi:hypothetical protein Nmul_A2006 [Nitrosospira multiformis ATCC 25196]|uniref:Uncharacterized protein n=1 Tax=Nitrosospira multiformis (strain ATCC 25196 / NCIMB 11849 / C 71) TaxID=323848 RepID=Q2Y7H0_NITMU|nr:hypothetical protein Nmul_A2006 [Nitrosospira multiformis ATCC 25196]